MRSGNPFRDGEEAIEYVNMELPNGEAVRFRRVWSGHRFTDNQTAMLIAGMEIVIHTEYARGIIGSLEWQEYNGYDYYGFSPWDAEAYNTMNAPFPVSWNGHTFTPEEEAVLRRGDKLLLLCISTRTGSPYAVHVTYAMHKNQKGENRWGIVPHFDEFDQSPDMFTIQTCPFMPVFGGRALSQSEIAHVRNGGGLRYEGVSKKGNPYTCVLRLELDAQYNRWRLMPTF